MLLHVQDRVLHCSDRTIALLEEAGWGLTQSWPNRSLGVLTIHYSVHLKSAVGGDMDKYPTDYILVIRTASIWIYSSSLKPGNLSRGIARDLFSIPAKKEKVPSEALQNQAFSTSIFNLNAFTITAFFYFAILIILCSVNLQEDTKDTGIAECNKAVIPFSYCHLLFVSVFSAGKGKFLFY